MNEGRACSACHVTHSPTVRDDVERTSGVRQTRSMLWGKEVPAITQVSEGKDSQRPDREPDIAGMLSCLSCHDGNYAPEAMLKNVTFEHPPEEKYGAADSVPTFLDQNPDGNASSINAPSFQNHPSGLNAQIHCGGDASWDCMETDGVITMQGPRSAKFAANYGVFVQPKKNGRAFVVVCTTCHNPHSMNKTRVSRDFASFAYPEGTYLTRHFLRAPDDFSIPTQTGNQSAQFCRQCHADKSNEMNGSSCGTRL